MTGEFSKELKPRSLLPASGEKVPKADEGVVTDANEAVVISYISPVRPIDPLTLTLSPTGERGPELEQCDVGLQDNTPRDHSTFRRETRRL